MGPDRPLIAHSGEPFGDLLGRIRACRLCEHVLPLGPRPVLQADPRARILIAGQAPGRRVHATGLPFDDPSGDRLRSWLGVDREAFYDPARFAIVPMGLCYPGTGAAGDLPPRPECAPLWRPQLVPRLTAVTLTVAVGRYAIDWHLGRGRGTVAEVVRRWKQYGDTVPTPHPSPRNVGWFARNPWFESELVPALRDRVASILGGVTRYG